MLAKLDVSKALIEATAERFRGGSVFSRPCPHAIAARLERAQAETDRGRAIALVREVCTDAPEEPKFQLALAAMLAGGAPIERIEATAMWTAIANSTAMTSTIRAQAYDRLAQLAADDGELARARSLVATALALPIDGAARRQLEAYAFALDPGAPPAPRCARLIHAAPRAGVFRARHAGRAHSGSRLPAGAAASR